MELRKFATSLVASFVLAAGAAQAASLNIVDSGAAGGLAAGVIPDGKINDLLGPLGLPDPLSGYYGSAITVSGSGVLKAELYGWEAGYKNDFNFNGVEIFTNKPGNKATTAFGAPLGVADLGLVGAGLLNFSFDTESDAFHIINGVGENISPVRGFFASVLDNGAATSGKSIWLFLDDGGAGPDDNHDDLAVLLTITPVPVPAAGFLLIAGLGGLAALKRRKKA